MSKRLAKRFIRRLEIEFSGAGIEGRGITSDLSKRGVFIRTQKVIPIGTILDMKIRLPDGRSSSLKGIVRRAVKIPFFTSEVKNGIGVEIIENDAIFNELLDELDIEKRDKDIDEKRSTGSEDFIITTCPSCGVKNKVPISKFSMTPRCGRCRALLNV